MKPIPSRRRPSMSSATPYGYDRPMLLKPVKRTALVLTGELGDLLAVIICQELGRRGMDVTVAGLNGSGATLRLSRYCRAFVPVATTRAEMESEDPGVVDRVEKLARKIGAGCVFAVDVPGSLCASRLRRRLPALKYFPFPDPETVKLLDNKWTFYQFLTKEGLPSPRTWLIECREAALLLPLPLVLKPLNMSAGRGVRTARTSADLQFLLDGGDKHLRLPVVAQEFVDGPDGSLSFLAENGRVNASTIHVRGGDDGRQYIDDERILDFGRRIAQALAYTGLANIGFRFAGPYRADVKLIECNPRVWASLPATEGLEVDFIGRGLELSEGRTPIASTRSPTGECASLRGILRRIAAGRRLSVCESAALRRAARDPLPVLGRGVMRLLGLWGAS